MSSNFDVSGMLPLGEKRKVLNQFINSVKEADITNILKECERQPKDLYNLIKLSLADKFRCFDLMMELLHNNGDAAMLNRILSKHWIYKGEHGNKLADSHFLLDVLFPEVSHNCQRKLIHKIGKFVHNECKINELWKNVCERYGFDVAFPLFPGCPEDVVTDVIVSRKVFLSGYQLVQILRKYVDIGVKYLKENPTRFSKINSRCSPIQYLYEHRPEEFCKLCMSEPNLIGNFAMGRRRSTKMIRAHRDTLLANPSKAAVLLKIERIKRAFSSDEYQMFFESTLPARPYSIDSTSEWARYVHVSKRNEMVQKAYQKLYEVDLLDHPEFLTIEFICRLPAEQKLAALASKSNDANNIHWSYKGLHEYCHRNNRNKILYTPLKPICNSVTELKKLLFNEQDVHVRSTLSRYLIETCYINDDLPQLFTVLQLLNRRSKNDRSLVRKEIFGAITKIMHKMKFSKRHWDVIYEMIRTSMVFKDNDSYTEVEAILGKYVVYCVQSRLPMNDLVGEHMKMKRASYGPYYASINLNDVQCPEDKRILLELYVKEIENEYASNEHVQDAKLADFVFGLVEMIRNFNEFVAGGELEPISLESYPWLMSNFERCAQQEEARLNECCKKQCVSAKQSKFKRFSRRRFENFWVKPNKYLKIVRWFREKQNLSLDAFHGADYFYSKMWLCLPNHATILHFLERNPSHLIDNWSASMSRMLETKTCIALMKTLKQWDYSHFVAETIVKCTELMKAEEGDDAVQSQRKYNATLVLSALKEPIDWLKTVAEYYPPESKVDIFEEHCDRHYHMRGAIAGSLMNISPDVHLAFDAIKRFCVGDYLKLTIPSMYSLVCRAASQETLKFLHGQLTNVPVSFQKHVIRLYCYVCTLKEKCAAVKRIDSPNVTISYIVFLEATKLFRLSPTQETWGILKYVMDNATVDDTPILEFVHSTPDLDDCPEQFMTEYVDTCLALLQKLDCERINKFMTMLERVMRRIPGDTLDKILLRHFGSKDTFKSSFCSAYLTSAATESILEHRVSKIWSILADIIESGWYKKVDCKYPARSLVHSFIVDLYSLVKRMNKAWLESAVYRMLLEKFHTLPEELFFPETLLLHLALLSMQVAGQYGVERLRLFGRGLAKFIDSLVEVHGHCVIFIALDTLEKFVTSLFSPETSKEGKGILVELCDEMIAVSASAANQIFAIKIFNGIIPVLEADHFVQLMNKNDVIISELNNHIVQLYHTTMNH